MTWFKVDDSLHGHPKAMAASLAALGLWTVAGSWSSNYLTDGFVPDHMVQVLARGETHLVEELVRAGLWTRARGGYRFRDWSDYNPSANDVKRERDAARERMRKLRENRKNTGQRGNRSGEHNANVQENFGDRSQPRPDPTRSSSNEELSPPASPVPPKGADKTRGTRLPEHFPVTDEMRAWAAEKTPLVGDEDHAAFLDYWRSVSGAKGVKRDWVATWRNWMRRAQKDHERRQPAARRAPAARPGPDERAAGIQALKDPEHIPDNVLPITIRGEIA